MEAREELKKVIDNFALHFHEISGKYGFLTVKSIFEGAKLDRVVNSSLKEAVKENVNLPKSWSHNLNIKKLKSDLIDKGGYLSFLYEIPREQQEYFLAILAHTSLAKIYYSNYAENWRELKKKKLHKQHNSIFDKVIEIIEFENIVNNNVMASTSLEYMKYLKQTALNNHYTERQLFEDFLFRSHKLLNINNDQFSKSRIIKIVNNVIECYFDSDIKFTNKFNIENLDNFISKTYNYETARGIDLIHTIPKRK